MQEQEKYLANGTEYKLVFDGYYKWTREGSLPKALEGGYTNPLDARAAFFRYLVSIDKTVTDATGEEDLESLTKKSDLLKWASVRNIEIPAKYKQPLAIKKFLLGEGA